MKNILFLSPHPDDIELGCGATLARLQEEGDNIYVAIFSDCKESVPNNFDEKEILTENLNSLKILNIKQENIFYFNYKVRTFNSKRQSILDDILKLKEKIKPDIVFVPSTNDYHQDHNVINLEAIRAFKHCASIYGYQLNWNLFEIKNNFIYEIKKEHLDKKILALSKYKTQKEKQYFNLDYIISLAILFGINTNSKYAESFEIIYKIEKL